MVLQENKVWGRARGREVGRSGRKLRHCQVIANGQQTKELLEGWWGAVASAPAECGEVLRHKGPRSDLRSTV